eukprot:CAMPEP_0116090904 /NCGR_PEP_ID=MMETSP0327-20121206/7218_1 /TAXON_ID=44447 /ORGANISM="Pseudo-nitzschia delicatissima, Strain B596" /LENGTH=391 /DNA_ID=CAMNT_0003582215 /DNA_START=87 /DNA_END=1262 /DNA_ORIENTATION=-
MTNEATPLLQNDEVHIEEEHRVHFGVEVNGDGNNHEGNEPVDIETGGDDAGFKGADTDGKGDEAEKGDKKIKKRRKKKGVQLNYRTALALETQVRMNLIKHSLAADFFNWQQYWKFTFPQAVFTALSSTLAFSASSSIFSQHAESINLFVGSLSALVVLIQTISGFKNYGVRADRHRNVAVQLRDLADDIALMKFKLNMVEEQNEQHQTSLRRSAEERAASPTGKRRGSTSSFTLNWDEHPGNKEKSDSDDDEAGSNEHTFDSIQKRYQQSLSGCSSNVPLELSEAFHGLASNLEIAETKENIERLHEVYGHIHYRSALMAKAYAIMAGEILNDPFFPAWMPDSKRMVKQSMNVLKDRLKKSTSLYEGLFDEEEEPPRRFSFMLRRSSTTV